MEENKKIEFESYLESQGLDKETEEKIAKDKSDKLARIQEIKTDESMNAADKIQEILAIITSKYKESEKSQGLRMEHQKKIKESEATKAMCKHLQSTVDSKRDKLVKAADMFKQLYTALQKINKDLLNDNDDFVEEAKKQRAAMKANYEESLKKMSDDIQKQRLQEYQEKNEQQAESHNSWRNKILELSDKFKEKQKEMKEIQSEPFQDLTTNMTNYITQNYLQKFQNNLLGATEIENEVRRIEEENEAMKHELQLYKKKYEEVKETMDKNDEAMKTYDEKLAELDETKNTAQSEITKLKKECDSYSIELITLMEEKRILMKHLEEVKNRCDKLNAASK